jgi:predicted Fe-S protein YdhL (DUF1289 family)
MTVPENDPVPSEPVSSPCTRVCVIDPVSKLCRGCLRTIDEITDWSGKSPAEKRAVLAVLKERRVN